MIVGLLVQHGFLYRKMKCVRLVLVIFAVWIRGVTCLQDFDTKPTDTEVNPGETIVLTCKIRNRKGECAWLKDGFVVGKIPNKYTFQREPSDGDCSITITNTRLEDDDGLWQCQVTQDSLQEPTLTSPEVKITVREAPNPPRIEDNTIQIQPGDPLTARVGEAKRLHCVARKGNPPAEIRWFIDDEEITAVANQTNSPDIEKQKTWMAISVLEYIFDKDQNRRVLKCVAIHNAYHMKSKDVSVRLEVLYAPKIKLEGRPTEEIVEGSSLSLKCTADANPKASIIWRKSGHFGIYDIKDQIDFHPIRRTDTGVYSCSAKNDIGQSEEIEINVDVKYKPKINFIDPSPRTTVSLYQPGKLRCEAEGNPSPLYTWLQKLSGDPVVWRERGHNSSLYIYNVTYAYQGIYLCQASNVINGVEQRVQSEELSLDVTGPPQILLGLHKTKEKIRAEKDEDAIITIYFCADPSPRKSFWEWGSLKLDTGSDHIRFIAEPLQRDRGREDCYEARLIVQSVEGSDSRIYTLNIENEKGSESFAVALEVIEPVAVSLVVGMIASIVVLLVLIIVIVLYLFKTEKLCFNRSRGFKPSSLRVVENGCPSDNQQNEVMNVVRVGDMASDKFRCALHKPSVPTVCEEAFQKDSLNSSTARNIDRGSLMYCNYDLSSQHPDIQETNNSVRLSQTDSRSYKDNTFQSKQLDHAYI